MNPEHFLYLLPGQHFRMKAALEAFRAEKKVKRSQIFAGKTSSIHSSQVWLAGKGKYE